MNNVLKKDDYTREENNIETDNKESNIKKYSKITFKCFGYIALLAAYGAVTLLKEEIQEQKRTMKYANTNDPIDINSKYK